MNIELQVYQKKTIDHFNEVCTFTGKKVLEIGGSPPYNVAREFLNRGARNVITIDYRTDIPNRQIAENLDYFNMDARDLKFPGQEFDIVFGVALLEHLHDLDKVLVEISRVLVKGGYAYLHGGPLWSCKLGHHVWVRADGVKYEFNANNPIPHWYHLIYQEDEMRRYLETRNLDPAHARKIAAWVYNDPILNRYPYETYIRLLKETNLSIVKLTETSWGEPPQDILDRLEKIDSKKQGPISRFFRRRKSAANRNHSTGEIEVILRK